MQPFSLLIELFYGVYVCTSERLGICDFV